MNDKKVLPAAVASPPPCESTPWHAAGGIVRDSHDHDIAAVVRQFDWEPQYGPLSRERIGSIARLIAAAPDLLRAGRKLLLKCREYSDLSGECAALANAINKADGGRKSLAQGSPDGETPQAEERFVK